MKLISTFAFLAVSFLGQGLAHADDPITLGQPQMGGSGCPQGTASATLSPDQSALSILFDQFQVNAGGSSGKRFDRKACNIAIPVHVPQGYSISVMQIDYRGFNNLPYGASTRFNVEYFFAGSQGPRYSRNFQGPLNSDYTLSNQLVAQSLVWSECGADVNLRTNASLLTMTNRNYDETMSTVDSADVKASIVYHIQWRRCGDGGSGFDFQAF